LLPSFPSSRFPETPQRHHAKCNLGTVRRNRSPPWHLPFPFVGCHQG
jgi:hypothetical protein